jgi:hypothetical protein
MRNLSLYILFATKFYIYALLQRHIIVQIAKVKPALFFEIQKMLTAIKPWIISEEILILIFM